MKKIFVVVDAGHYGKKYNQGIFKDYFESDRMYTLSTLIVDKLKEYNIDCCLTRNEYNNPSLLERGEMAITKSKGYDEVVFISNHSNAFDTESACGVLGFRSCYLPKSATLLNSILEGISDKMNTYTKVTYNRGIQTKKSSYGYDWLGVLQGATSRAISIKQAESRPCKYAYLIEYGFHTNKKECEFLMSDDNLKGIADVVVKAIADYFEITKELYRVRKSWSDPKSQLGAFTILDNAKALQSKNKGYHIYNSKGELVL